MRENLLQAVDDLQVIKDEVIRVIPVLAGKEGTQAFQAAVLVFSAAWLIGPDTNDLIAFTGYPRDLVVSVAQRMRSSGLWDEGYANDDWHIRKGQKWSCQDQICPTGFWLHVLVARGMVTVVGRDDDGELLFAAVGNGADPMLQEQVR